METGLNTESTNLHGVCIVVCDSAGVMYWGDASLDKIETAYVNGTGRKTLLTETKAHYFAFTFHAGNVYFTDWNSRYVLLFSMRHYGSAKTQVSSASRHMYLPNLRVQVQVSRYQIQVQNVLVKYYTTTTSLQVRKQNLVS